MTLFVDAGYRQDMGSTRRWVLVGVVGWLLLALAPSVRAQVYCAGDCGGDGPVTIDEITSLIAVALEAAPLSACAAGDIDHDGEIRVDEILAAVHVALTECPALAIDPATEARCDPLGEPCVLPWPNDYFTVPDAGTATGRRLALVAASLPANASGVHIDPSDQNRADGWSPGSPVLVRLDGLDAARSRLPGLADARASLAADAPIVLLDATTGARHPFWAELDAIADEGETPLLMIHPSRNFPDGHRLVVALRGLVDADGRPVPAAPAFVAYRDGQRTTDARFEARRPAMERIFADLDRAGVARASLQLAWDFTVASTASLTGRMLAMRDDAFAALADAAPAFTVDMVTADPNPFVRRRVEGTFQVPLYLTQEGRPGGRLVLDAAGRPQRQAGTFTARYTCNLRRRPRTPRRACPSTDTACSATAAKSTAASPGACRPTTTSPTAPPTGTGCRKRTSASPSPRCRISPPSRRCPTGCSRACSPSSSSGG
ncbi:MAG: hypothetical protein U0802_15135 [Candidatus Binatia bacterium]